MKNLFVCLFVLLTMVTTTVWADDKQNISDSKGNTTAKGEAVDVWATAVQLTSYGRNTNNALALIVAAQMVKSTPAQIVSQEKISEGDAVSGAEKQKKPAFSAETLLSEAAVIAADDLQLMAIIDSESKRQGTKGDVTGPNRHVDRVEANATDTYSITFRGDEIAEILVIGDGDTDLDLYVYDENGNLIEKDDDYTDSCYVRMIPRWTGDFKVKIKNRGSVYNEYVLITN